MGVGAATAEFLAEARADGVDFSRTLTIGRQASFVGPVRLGRLLRRHGVWPAGVGGRSFYRTFRDGPPWLAEPYLAALGAREVAAMDVSDYEGAEVIHDLNEPLPEDMHERFDVVLDAGSLEHVFDVPTALRSYMQMVRVGGRLIVQTMANNHCGHGFYQFSPELFFRVLSEENGYELERLHLAAEDIEFSRPVAGVSAPFDPREGRFSVADPESVGGRVLLRTGYGVTLLVQARRVRAVPVLTRPPLQSDYKPMWAGGGGQTPAPVDGIPAGPLRSAFRRAFPPEARMVIALDLMPRLLPLLDPLRRARVARQRSFRNRRHFRRVR
ncbi:MAG TPA: hypothetical protein VF545_09850 [Thermoleophilaceae bacterium]|jgi:SAM-dependent methyltransferase